MITGIGHTTPGNPVALSKHTAKDELSAIGKGKWNANLSSYAHLSVEELHSGFLNCLHSNRDYEAGLVNLMKERYEVFSSPFLSWFQSLNISPSSPQGPVYDVNHKPGLCNILILACWSSICKVIIGNKPVLYHCILVVFIDVAPKGRFSFAR